MLSPEKRFKETLEDLLSFLFDLHEDIFDENLTELDPDYTKSLLISIKGNSDLKILNIFSNNYDKWIEIKNKNEGYISNLVDMLSNSDGALGLLEYGGLRLPFDINQEENDIIEDEDIEYIWDLLTAMVKISCSYIHEGRNPSLQGDEFIYSEEFYEDIDLDLYTEMFNLTLS